MGISDAVRFSFLLICSFFILILIFLSIYMYKRGNKYKTCIIRPILVAIAAIIVYCLFLVSNSHNLAVFFDALFFIGTDWLAMFMLFFAIGYTGIAKDIEKKLFIFFSIICTADTISLLVNNFTYHMFDLVPMTSSLGITFWGNAFRPLHYAHLGYCYVMVLLTCLYLGISIYKAPGLCKTKYVSILVAYIIVILINCVSYSFNLPVDTSVILYAGLAGFICYYSTFTYPNKMLAATLRSVNDTVSDAIMYFNVSGECIYSNRPAQLLFENDHKFEPYLAEAYKDKIDAELKKNQNILNIEDVLKINGRERHFAVEYRKEYFSNQPIGSYIKLVDITEDYVNYRKERYTATHDPFTGILNRNGFFEAVDKLIEDKGTFGYVMVISNIRDFKVVNEMFGEKAGDDIIYKQASILKTFSHSGTLFARICDDKFAVYTKKENFDEDEFRGYMDLMQKAMDGPSYSLKIIVGVYSPQGRVETAQSMYDKALVATTKISGNYTEVFAYYDNELTEKLLFEKKISLGFDSAVENNQIKMLLQPVFDADKKYKGAEAVSRWYHPEEGLLIPEQFLPILEEAGSIYKLDTYIWEEAAKLLQKWSEKGITDCFISVNVSFKDFFYCDIYKVFTRLVERYDILPENLHIEITESVLMSDFARVFAIVSKLQKAGFIVAVDNFGNDYSSLNMLKDFTVQSVKIGMSLFHENDDATRNWIIIEHIIHMAHDLGIEVVSEGIETEEQFKKLCKFNCKYYQGDYLAKPYTVEEFEEAVSH